MTLENIVDEVKQLPLAEQIELWGVLGDMIGPPRDVPLTPAQAEDLGKRIEEYHAGKAEMLPGEEVMARLRARL